MRPRASRWQGVFAAAATKSEAEAAGYPPAMSSTTTRSPSELDRLRRRSLGTLVGSVALGSTGHIAAVTVATIVASDMNGSIQLAGTPVAAIVFGAALGVERTRIQGLADGLVWSTSALASLGSGVLLAAAGYAALGVLGAILVVIPAGVLTLRRSGLAATPSG
jgi:hypothetical protein